jgi:hypothetical protein
MRIEQMKILVLTVLVLYSLLGYTQCNCSGTSYGTGIFDQGAGILHGKHVFSAQVNFESRMFAPREQASHDHHAHDHGSDTNLVEEAEMRKMFSANIGLVYQLSKRWMFMAQIPYLHAYSSLGNKSGNGDLSFLAGYGILNNDKHRLFLLAGVESPTGKVLPFNDNPVTQFGSGAFDPMGGLAFGFMRNNWSLQGSLLHKRTTKNQNNDNIGATSQVNATGMYAIIPEISSCNNDSVSTCRKNVSWNAGITINLEHYGKQTQNNVLDASSGGALFWAGFSSVFVYKKISLPILVSTPVFQQWNAENQATTFRWRIGLCCSF